jgi:hypothetical protein
MSEFVWAYNVRGEKRRVPAHWIGHPVIKGWRLTPSQRAKATKKSTARKSSRKTPSTGDNTPKEQ